MAFDIWAQADVVVARLTVIPTSTAGLLETTVMEAIGVGVTTPFDLADILGLAPSLVLDVLGDLWRAGRISVNLGTDHESLALTSSGQAELAAAGHDSTVETTSQSTTTEELVIDRLTGRVLPAQFAKRRPTSQDWDLVIPALPTDKDGSEVSADELVVALAGAMDADKAGLGDKYRDRRVLAASLQPALLQDGAQRRYVKINVSAHRSEIDELTISVVDERLSLRERELATKRLQEILDSQPRSKFANRVRERSTRVPLEPQGIDRTVKKLEQTIASMPDCSANMRQQRHDQAAYLTAQITTYARSLALQEMNTRLITSTDDHRTAVNELIRAATSQVVLAVPWLRMKGLEAIRSNLIDALEHGVQFVLLWGIDGHADGLGDDEASWLDSISAHVLRSGAPGRLLYSRNRAARSHAKVAIADDRRMLITSKNFLSNSNHTEVGVVLDALKDQESPTINAALRYVYDKAPTPQIAFNLYRVPGSFGARTVPDVPDVSTPRFTNALTEQQAPEASVRAWSAAWEDCAEQLTDLLSRANPTVELLADLQHRGVLRNALKDAHSRVLVTSDKLSDNAVSDDIVALARTRAHEDVPVRFRFRSTVGEGQARVDTLSSPSNEQQRQASIGIARNADMHAKIVLRDDRVLVGSFNPLSVDADLRQRRSTGELGVDIRSSAVADDVWSVITGERPNHTAREAAQQTNERSETGRPRANLAQALLEALESPAFEPVLTIVRERGFHESFNAYAGFATDGVGAVRLGAAGLLVDLERGDIIEASATVLLQQQLRQGNWGVAHLLREHIDDDGARPSRQFTQALHDGGASGESLLCGLTADGELSLREYEALTVVDCVALLLGNAQTTDSDTFFDVARSQSTTESHEFVEAAIAYLHRYSALPITPPTPTNSSGPADDATAVWTAAGDAVANFRRYDSHSAAGDAFHSVIFGPEGEMTALEAALAERNADAVREWYAAFVPNKRDDKWLDRTTHAAGVGRIVDNRRRSFLEFRSKVRNAVQRLHDSLGTVESDDAVVWDAVQMASLEHLLGAGRALHAERSDTDLPADAIVAREITRLLDWAMGERAVPPARDWTDGTFVSSWIATSRDPSIRGNRLLEAIARDLGTVRSHNEAIIELARFGEFSRARSLTDHLLGSDILEAEEAEELLRRVARLRTEAEQDLLASFETQQLRNERAGIELRNLSTPRFDEDEDLIQARAHLAEYEAASQEAYAPAKAEVVAQFESRRTSIAPGWSEYVDSLIEADEFLLAEQALLLRDGNDELPRPRPFARWSWPKERIGVVARWFDPDCEEAPRGMRERFVPAADDTPGRNLIAALQSLGGPNPDAQAWVDAVQQFVNADDEDFTPQLATIDGHTSASFLLPYSQRLPRLRWVGRDPVTVAVGESEVPGSFLRLSMDVSRAVATDPVIDIADLLSLLARRDGANPPSREDRKLQFLTIACSRLPLGDVIDPDEMPARMTERARRQLAWLLSIVGVEAEVADIDRLRIWAGEHGSVLWTLVDTARSDPASGVAILSDRAKRKESLIRGFEMDLERDEDILLLAVGIAGGCLEIGCTAAELAGAFQDEWNDSGRTPHGLRLSDVIERLIAKSYIVQDGGLLKSCNCAASLALADTATADWIRERMDSVEPSRFVQDRAYVFILERIRHQQQAARDLLDEDAIEERACRSLREELSDSTAFDLAELCDAIRSDYRRPECDVFFEGPGHPMRVEAAGPRIWIELLITELINNAVAAVKSLEFGAGTVWVTLEPDARRSDVAILRVRNNGARIPAQIANAFAEGRIWRTPNRPERGTGLVSFKRFGDLKNVAISLQETELGETVVECRIPLAPEA